MVVRDSGDSIAGSGVNCVAMRAKHPFPVFLVALRLETPEKKAWTRCSPEKASLEMS